MRALIGVLLLGLAQGAWAQEPLAYIALEPCRLMDTRVGPHPLLEAGEVRAFTATNLCGIPFEAKALEATFTITGALGPGHFSVMVPASRLPDNPQPKTSLLNYDVGLTVANSAVVKLGAFGSHSWDGSFWMLASVSGAHVIVDVSGYYVAIP